MPNEDLIREIAIRAWSEALHEKSQELAEDVARRMGAALAAQIPQAPQPAQRQCSRELRDGAMLISGSKTQTETLDALLAASSALTPACGLLILRGSQAGGWNCMGLTSADNFKRAILDCSRGVAATVLNSCAARAAKASELDPAFIARLGLGSSAELLLLPVLLKERVAALLLAVSGSSDDMAGLEVLVQVAQLALDIQAYRKAAPQPVAEAPRPATAVPRPAPVQAAAAESRGTLTSPPSPEPASAPAVVESSPVPTYVASAPAVAVAPSPVAAVAAPAPSQPVVPVADETHDRARRFAKLLVEEIKLYNQSKVADGRSRGDLYGRLHDDIEKSRAAYQKRYGESVKDVDYFTQELIRILADNDRTVMGAGFPG
jgi:hypothetical protein